MKYILNFDMNKIKELNLKGMKDFNNKVEERTTRAEKETDAEAKKKIKAEKVDKFVLDTDDILILRFLYTMGKEPKTVRLKKDKTFFWIKLGSLLDEYEGLLFLSKTALNVRLNKYVEMGLIERFTERNEDGTFAFFKITGLENLIYIPVDSNGKKPIEGQQHITDFIEEEVKEEVAPEAKEKSDIEIIVEATKCTSEEAETTLKAAQGKNNPVGAAIDAIKKGYSLTPEAPAKENSNINPLKFNNFEAREYDYNKLEAMLTGQVEYNENDIHEVLGNKECNYTSNNNKIFNGIQIGA